VDLKADFLNTTLVLRACPQIEEKKMMIRTLARTATTDMEVTSIRLERELKEKLKDLSGNQGYQALIRDVLWNYVQQKSGDYRAEISPSDIRASIEATAQQEERCVLTGKFIRPQERMLLGLTTSGDMVPMSVESLSNQ
jgi:predicted DNA-binding protein